ncbi:MAG: LptE family protein [Bacteroidales bacterium]
MHNNHYFPVLLIVLLSLTWLPGCGVYSFTGASIPPQAETVSVSHFPNDASMVQPTLSQYFTESLQDKFLRQTNLQLVDGVGHLHFEGAITDYETEPVAISGDDRAARNRLTITVEVSFYNEFDEDADFNRSFSRYYEYDSNLSLSEVEDEAMETITEELVEDIFNQAVVDW